MKLQFVLVSSYKGMHRNSAASTDDTIQTYFGHYFCSESGKSLSCVLLKNSDLKVSNN